MEGEWQHIKIPLNFNNKNYNLLCLHRNRDKKWEDYHRSRAVGSSRGPPTSPGPPQQRMYPESRYDGYSSRER